jgi:hypothetical protein
MPASAKGITPKGTKCDVGPKRKAGARAIKKANKKTTKHPALKRTSVSQRNVIDEWNRQFVEEKLDVWDSIKLELISSTSHGCTIRGHILKICC